MATHFVWYGDSLMKTCPFCKNFLHEKSFLEYFEKKIANAVVNNDIFILSIEKKGAIPTMDEFLLHCEKISSGLFLFLSKDI